MWSLKVVVMRDLTFLIHLVGLSPYVRSDYKMLSLVQPWHQGPRSDPQLGQVPVTRPWQVAVPLWSSGRWVGMPFSRSGWETALHNVGEVPGTLQAPSTCQPGPVLVGWCGAHGIMPGDCCCSSDFSSSPELLSSRPRYAASCWVLSPQIHPNILVPMLVVGPAGVPKWGI